MISEEPKLKGLRLPKIGQKIKFKGQPKFSMLSNIKEDSKMLKEGNEYTVHWIEVGSSCCHIWLSEFLPEDINGYTSHRRPYFSLSDFEFEICGRDS